MFGQENRDPDEALALIQQLEIDLASAGWGQKPAFYAMTGTLDEPGITKLDSDGELINDGTWVGAGAAVEVPVMKDFDDLPQELQIHIAELVNAFDPFPHQNPAGKQLITEKLEEEGLIDQCREFHRYVGFLIKTEGRVDVPIGIPIYAIGMHRHPIADQDDCVHRSDIPPHVMGSLIMMLGLTSNG